ncbi:hypothetical protein KC131_03520 [Pseudomonas sp. JQ170]|uniref:hypothetical protein n=1 Tax=unclassified Pseudomonas TaxID=196821 RepID=UPI00264E4B9F|nr:MULTISPECIES: hypothetical protein [unclassified Pseudomonas]MDN7139703.1 hypothetical protein [Pseudomonas sp. JQ170]WRO76989.1 hypothetical protein U9R80_04725 [Pseudomonas sp. 170C]
MTVLNLVSSIFDRGYSHTDSANLRLLMQIQAGCSQVLAAANPSQPITVEALPCL